MEHMKGESAEVLLDEAQLQRLPQYARGELRRLSGLLEAAYRSLDERPSGNAVLNPYGSVPTQLGDDPTIEYRPSKGVGYVIDCRKGKIEVSTTGSFSGGICILPRVSNLVVIQCEHMDDER